MPTVQVPDDKFNVCPFITGPYAVIDSSNNIIVDILWTECISSHCKLWDSTSENCSIYMINQIQKHIHLSHQHVKPHSASSITTGVGSPVKKSSPYSVALVSESSSGEDLDGNGYIYGKHFIINPNDPDIPEMLKTAAPVGFKGDKISWADYLDSTSKYSIKISTEG